MLSVTESMLLRFYTDFKENKDYQQLITLSILTLMNIHIVRLPVLQSLASQIHMCAPRKAK